MTIGTLAEAASRVLEPTPAACEISTTTPVERPRDSLPPKKSATPHINDEVSARRTVTAEAPSSMSSFGGSGFSNGMRR